MSTTHTLSSPSTTLRRAVLVAVGGLWLATIVAGSYQMLRYRTTPGDVGPAPAAWPAGTAIPRPSGRTTLLVFSHPKCPCTRATLDELARIMEASRGAVDASVWFYAPASKAEAWTKGELWGRAGAIPGVNVHADVDGAEAARFGAKTSGHVAVYDPSGALLYNGGITGMRGETGENAGADAVAALLAGPATGPRPASSVFGCPIVEAPAPTPR